MLTSLIRRLLDLDALDAFMEEQLSRIENYPENDEE